MSKKQSAKLIPAILASSASDFKTKFFKFSRFADTIQIDIMDGTFVPNRSWANPRVIQKIKTKARFELHLMVRDPLTHMRAWRGVSAVFRVIFHIEPITSTQHICDILSEAYFNGWEVGIALNPRTSLDRVRYFIEDIDTLLLLGVQPGKSGQRFQKSVLKKIARTRSEYTIPIAVDGGVQPDTIRSIISAGASRVISASMLLSDGNISALKRRYHLT